MLIACAILLYSYMRTDWIRDSHMRFRVLALGLALLFISLLVCIYATKRMGLCAWPAPQQQTRRRRTLSHRPCLPVSTIKNHSQLTFLKKTNKLQPRESQLQLIIATELPPSYDSVMSSDFPPPYNSVTFHISNETGEVTRSTLTPIHSVPRPSGTG